MKKYLITGGYIISKDGDKHYVSASELVILYNLKRDECQLVETRTSEEKRTGLLGVYTKGLRRLYPRRDGNYCLPGVNE